MADNHPITPSVLTSSSGEVQTYVIGPARVESNLPIAYRLIRRGDGNGNMVPVLQGMFTWNQGVVHGRDWRDLETQDEPYIEDRVPFG